MTDVVQRELIPTSSAGISSDADVQLPARDRMRRRAAMSHDHSPLDHRDYVRGQLLTGIRMATFGYVLPGLSHWLSRSRRKARLDLAFLRRSRTVLCSSAYLIYLNRGGLTAQRPEEVRVALMPVAARCAGSHQCRLHWLSTR